MLRYSDTSLSFAAAHDAAPKPTSAADWPQGHQGEPGRAAATARQDRLQRRMWHGDDELAQLVDMALAFAG